MMHGDLRRELPNNLEAEQALLGAIFLNNEVMDNAAAPIEPKHFFEPLHGDIFDAMLELKRSDRLINPVTIKALVPAGMVGEKTVSQYLAHLAVSAVNVAWTPAYAQTIMDCAARRACISLGEKMDEAAYSLDVDIMDQVDALRGRFDDVVQKLTGGGKTKTLADAARNSLAATADAYRGKGIVGVDYGLPWLMNMIGPLLPGQEIIIGGMTKHGKSTLIEQMVAGAAMNGHPVWINSGEMKGEELARRALSRLTDIRAWQQVRGKVSEADYEKLEMARRNAETWQERVFIRDDTLTLKQIKREITEFSKHQPRGMAVIDYIGLVEKDHSQQRSSDVEFSSIVTRSLKLMAGECKLPIVAASQLKKNTFEILDRNINRKTYMAAISKRPKAADIFGSCEKDADHVIIPFRAEAVLDQLEPAEVSDLHDVWTDVAATVKDRAEIVLALSRHTKWPQRKEVGWDGPRTMFTDLQQAAQTRMF